MGTGASSHLLSEGEEAEFDEEKGHRRNNGPAPAIYPFGVGAKPDDDDAAKSSGEAPRPTEASPPESTPPPTMGEREEEEEEDEEKLLPLPERSLTALLLEDAARYEEALDPDDFEALFCKHNIFQGETHRHFRSRLFKIIDRNQDHLIQFGEVAMAVDLLANGTNDERLTFVFNLCDTNDNGSICQEELREFLRPEASQIRGDIATALEKDAFFDHDHAPSHYSERSLMPADQPSYGENIGSARSRITFEECKRKKKVKRRMPKGGGRRSFKRPTRTSGPQSPSHRENSKTPPKRSSKLIQQDSESSQLGSSPSSPSVAAHDDDDDAPPPDFPLHELQKRSSGCNSSSRSTPSSMPSSPTSPKARKPSFKGGPSGRRLTKTNNGTLTSLTPRQVASRNSGSGSGRQESPLKDAIDNAAKVFGGSSSPPQHHHHLHHQREVSSGRARRSRFSSNSQDSDSSVATDGDDGETDADDDEDCSKHGRAAVFISVMNAFGTVNLMLNKATLLTMVESRKSEGTTSGPEEETTEGEETAPSEKVARIDAVVVEAILDELLKDCFRDKKGELTLDEFSSWAGATETMDKIFDHFRLLSGSEVDD